VDTIKPGSAADRAAGEKAEKAISTLIAKRDKARRSDEAEQAREELWAESVRTYNAARDAQLRGEWLEYHQDQAARHRANLEALTAYHEEQSRKYLPKGAA
jgi:selenocysteine-specific translation elongation factor